MSVRTQEVFNLYTSVLNDLSEYSNWTTFLRTAAGNYKYSFEDQVLIFAQRPEATACADFITWNDKLHRRIKRGAKGIALLRKADNQFNLNYVFDISDTYKIENGIDIQQWKYDSKYDEYIMETLENSFGEPEDKTDIISAVLSAAKNAVKDNREDYLDSIKYMKENSYLEELDELNINMEFQRTAENSVAYVILQRMGLNPENIFEQDDFQYIADFNTTELLAILGNAVSSISEQALKEISDTIRAEIKKEKSKSDFFAKSDIKMYNTDEEQEIDKKENERTGVQNDGDHVQDGEWHTDTQYRGTGEQGTDRQIRDDERDIFEESPQELVFGNADERNADKALGGGRQNSERTDRTDDKGNGGIGRGDGTTQSTEPVGVGGAYEQPQTFSRGDSSESTHLQLNLFDIADEPNEHENMKREAERTNVIRPAFSIPQEIIDVVLCDGTHLEESILAICAEFSKDKPLNEKADFLREHYGTDGKGFMIDDKQIAAWWDSNGIKISYGNTTETANTHHISWEDAARRIDELLDLGRYAPANILLQIDDYLYDKAAEVFWNIHTDLNYEDYPELENLFNDEIFSWHMGYPDEKKQIKEYLQTSAGLDEIKTLVQQICDIYDEDKNVVRFRYLNPHKLNGMLADLYIVRKQYTAQELSYVPPVRFITEDEITKYLLQGTGYQDGKYRTYIFFASNSDNQARQQFLRNEYGIGGSYNGIVNKSYDGKGLSISRGNIMQPYAKTLLKWNEVAKRIDKLIKQGVYLDKSEIDNIPAYEKKQIADAVRGAYFDITDESIYRPFPKEKDLFDDVNPYIIEKLNNPDALSEMIRELRNLIMETPKDDKAYSFRTEALDMLESYSAGTLNLFPGIKIPVYPSLAELDRAKKLIDRYVQDEFDSESADYTDLRKVYLAYTETEDGEHEINVEVNLIDFSIVKYVDDTKVEEIKYESLSELIEKELKGMTFDDLVYLTDEQLAPFYKESEKESFADLYKRVHSEDDGKTVAVFLIGEFYEAYGADAEQIAEVFDFNLTKRTVDGIEYPMCGFPRFKLEESVNALTEKGFDVVLVDKEKKHYKILSNDKALGNTPEKEYDIGFGALGNGTTVWNRLEIVDNDYKTIAHISEDGKTVKYYEEVPDAVKERIEAFAGQKQTRKNVELPNWDEETVMRVAKEEWEKAHRTPVASPTLEQRNYYFVKSFAPNVLEGNVRYALYESKSFMPLHISKLSENTIRLAHTYEQNGDLMYDPEMVFEIDDENKALKPLEYRQDNMGIYQVVGENVTDRELSSFAVQWFGNIRNQGFHLAQEILEYNNEDITVSYNENGDITDIEGKENAVAEYKQEHHIEAPGTTQIAEEDISEETSENSEKKPEEPQADNIVGKEINIDDRKFIVDSINENSGTVSLKDITFETGTGFPIFRRESVEFVRAALEQQEQKERIIPEFEKVKPSKVQNTVIYPEIPMVHRNNFVIDNDELGYGGAKEKFRRNMDAIRVLKECEDEHRLATPDEQKTLSEYVGWGGLAEAFDESKANWTDEYMELKSALSPEEYEMAKASTLTAHYTSPVIIKAMYKALENMGFSQGNILEPSCGIGNFMGLIPDSMKDSKMYGIELDSITGRIAQQLYQRNSVAIEGFEDTMLPDSFFDVAVGNVPFGDYKLSDKKYNKYNFLIHDYFFAKTLDKVRPGGVIAFITSSGTMDKQNSKVRRYIAQRADLIGAIRLPNNAFLKNAGTEVTSDILFLQKRDRMTDIMPDWVELGTLENGMTVNKYFADNPEMILGEMQTVSGPFGHTPTCMPYEDVPLSEQLNEAIQNIHATVTEYEIDDISNDDEVTLPADPNVRNFSFTVIDGDVYFRENSIMRKLQLNATAENRIKGMIAIRDCVRQLIEYQTEGYNDNAIKAQQNKLNKLYDDFTKKYGLINSRGNSMAFSDDSSYYLLCSLEVIDENGEFERKADMFTKRTIGAKHPITKVDTASEALAVSLGEKAKVDIEFMQELTGKSEDELYEELNGVIFLNPYYKEDNFYVPKYLTADEYLSGNVRSKLDMAKYLAEKNEAFNVNVEALTAVQPVDLAASEITVRLGSTWIPEEDIKDFVFELLSPGWYAREKIEVKYTNLTGEWSISNKSLDKGIKATNTYGTNRINAYKIIEESLNLKDVRIFDYIEDIEGRKKAVLNKKETMIAQQKQDLIKSEFDNWIWKDPDRRERLTKLYNERFNSNRPREYDGSHIVFNGMNPEINLRPHQRNAVARIMYGGNSLLGHVVGAGKTWTMVAAAMEMKRLGLCNKSLFVVPNHLTEQWAAEFLQLCPAANILVATKKDFETKNRKKFCGRIATGDYDAVIIGHSQFEKIPMSYERQVAILEKQKDEIINGIIEAKESKAERYTVKQLEKSKRSIETKLSKLNDQSRKDDVVTFEELGVDRIFIDEAHYYKNRAKRCV